MSITVKTGSQEFAARPTAPRLRITARGRAVLTAVVALPVVVLIVLMALNGGGAIATGSAPSEPLQSVTVMAGDSLWDLAEDIAPEADPREVIADLVSLNTLVSAEVRPGQQLDVPREYSNH
ncbi:LysM domain-containing protein [Glaciihabitans tibetensis]|uniref:LysM domain-containing protein n=1 Tax=Glaciihabitans tibetensis TaxID=1266600 RepID=A0A2T0VHN1_9MICO|nr:LysM peptidoglycan-binding domain-containing protein [Glaciihabitans tibetensis]PRY69727.1 LysM domain-containing protein [Glaciihabitans tibetensis]